MGRFSTVAGEKGSADTVRDVRGFALKFYTEDGNWDMVGNNTPVFFIRDGIKFPDFIHTQKRDPQTNVKADTPQWDFWSQVPESLHQVTILFSDRGIPKGIPYMNGYGSHTYSFINADRERFWVKFHFKTQQGIQTMRQEEADMLAGKDADYHTHQLFEAIERGDYPKWTLYVQVMPELEAEHYRWNPFDLTKVWPHADYPLIEVGVMEMNRNPRQLFCRYRTGSILTRQCRSRHIILTVVKCSRPHLFLCGRSSVSSRRQFRASPCQRPSRDKSGKSLSARRDDEV